MAGLRGLFWWIDRWRQSTAYTDMALEAQGAYRNLLDEAHLRGGTLPNDDQILARACGDSRRWPEVRAAVMAKFELKPDGYYHNATLDAVLAESQRLARNQKAYRQRRAKGDNATGRNGDSKSDNRTDNARDNAGDNAVGRGVVYAGSRIRVVRWMHEEVCQML